METATNVLPGLLTGMLIGVIIGLLIGFAVGWFGKPWRTANGGQHAAAAAALEVEKQYLLAEKTRLLAEQTRITEQHAQLSTQLREAGHRVVELGVQLKYKDEELQTRKEHMAQVGQQFTLQFESLAQKILDEKTARFDKHQEKSLSNILTPLKDNISQFRKEFETRYTKENDDRISLREQITNMMTLNRTLSDQANNLTNALRGQVKHQGNWGEMILESILEYADLQKGIHYFVQEHTTGDEGQALYPDIIVRYPDARSIVIDSKVSLLNYEQLISATEPPAQKAALDLLLSSVYKHIDSLSGKKYQEAVGSLDFVLLFVPVEGAYITIMQAERDLWQYAYKKRVLLMSPTNLIAAMKLVYDMWKRDSINQNAQEIAEKAVKIFEKLTAFVEDFEKVGAQLDKAGATYREAEKKLHTGRGNVIAQASQMKNKISHNKPIRNLPTDMEERGLAEDEHGADA